MSRVRADNFSNKAGTGAPNFPNGLTGTAATFTVLTYDDVTNVDSIGIITARSGVLVGSGQSYGSVDGATAVYYGDGSNLSGVVSGIEIEEGGTSVGTSLTAINFASGATVTQGSLGITTVTIAAGIATEAVSPSGGVVMLNLSKQDHKVTASGVCEIKPNGSGTEADSHTVRIVNSGVSTVTLSSHFLFPSGSSPSLPTADGAISLISFTIHRAGSTGISTQLLSGASLNYS
jgi:hypothetical protein